MQSIQIWRALPSETTNDNLIGDIRINEAWPSRLGDACASIVQPMHLAGEVHRLRGSYRAGCLTALAYGQVLEIAELLDRHSSTGAEEQMLVPDAGSHALTLKVFAGAKEPRELAQLTIVPRARDSFLCDAAWSTALDADQETTGRGINPRLTVRFWPSPVSPWTVLRVVINLLKAGSDYGCEVAAFHHGIIDDFPALPRAFGSK